MGVAFHSLEAATPARLLKNADVAMYRAKGEGRIGCGAIVRQRSPIADMAEGFSG
ncbi:MAG: hypothetical protein ACLR0N_11030 [Bilophila wadsworthia]